MNKKIILEYPDYYVTNEGRIFKLSTNEELKTHINSRGYKYVNIKDSSGKKHIVFIHRIVAKMFCDNPENKNYVNHIDGDKMNNFSSNLEWVTPKENTQHAWKIGLCIPKTGISDNCTWAKLNEEQVKKIRSEYRLTGESYRSLAKKYGVSYGTIQQIIERKTWTYIEETEEELLDPYVNNKNPSKNKTTCPICGKEFYKTKPNHIYCSRECREISRTSTYPSKGDLENKYKELNSWKKVYEFFNISRKAGERIRKHP